MPGLHLRAMATVSKRDIDALWGPATPQFAYQLAERIRDLISELQPRDPVRVYGIQRMEDLDRLGQGTSKGAEAGH
jgi:hypothetical protein